MAFPPPIAEGIDWMKLDLTVRDLGNGHIESRYSVKTGKWSAPKLVKSPYLKVHGMAPAFNYGLQAYEGLKAHRSPKDDILIFRTAKHARRMQHSCSVVSIPEIPEDHFLTCVRLAVSLNAAYVPPNSSGGALYIRPVAFGSSPHMPLTPPSEYIFCVYVQPFSSYHGAAPIDALILENFDRAAPRGTGNAKVGGNYAPVIRHTDKARSEGFPITLHLDSQTRSLIDEFSTSGFVGMKQAKDGAVTLVVPDSDCVIESVTSNSVTEIAKSFGWTVEVREIPYTELPTFTEIMAAGTAAALVPIKSITCHSKGDKFEFPGTALWQKVYDQLKGVQAGKVEDQFGWCDVVRHASEYLPIDEVVGEEAKSEEDVLGAAKSAAKAASTSEMLPTFALSAALMGAASLLWYAGSRSSILSK